MRWFAERRQAKKVADFGFTVAQRGGSFETNCEASQVLIWLKSTNVQVEQESTDALVVHPIFTNGKVGSEAISLRVSSGKQRKTLVRITVHLNAKPGNLNLNALGPILKLIEEVSKVDQNWLPLT